MKLLGLQLDVLVRLEVLDDPGIAGREASAAKPHMGDEQSVERVMCPAHRARLAEPLWRWRIVLQPSVVRLEIRNRGIPLQLITAAAGDRGTRGFQRASTTSISPSATAGSTMSMILRPACRGREFTGATRSRNRVPRRSMTTGSPRSAVSTTSARRSRS